MLPQLTPLNGESTGSVQVPASPRFRGVRGRVEAAWFGAKVPRTSYGRTHAQKAGLRYEALAHRRLKDIWPQYRVAPSILFRDENGVRCCIPDGILELANKVVVFEIKFQHMPEAWWQLRRLYEPVVKALFPTYPILLIEVCRTYDPMTPFPEPAPLVDDIEAFVQNGIGFGVWRWKP